MKYLSVIKDEVLVRYLYVMTCINSHTTLSVICSLVKRVVDSHMHMSLINCVY